MGPLYVPGEHIVLFRLVSDALMRMRLGNLRSGDGQFQYPFGVAINSFDGGHVYVADTYNQRVQEFTNLGVFVRQWGTLGTGPGAFQYHLALQQIHLTIMFTLQIHTTREYKNLQI